MKDLISRADAIEAVKFLPPYREYWKGTRKVLYKKEDIIKALKSLLSADAEKKKAELKENGDWDCPDAGCDECDHYRSVSWCSLAIPNHEEIDDTYKMLNEAFFEGFESAEKRYRLLIETFEELDKKSAEAEPIVIRAKALMRKEDFDKWAEDIKKQNQNIVCIPCDAEVVSADAEWIPCSERFPKFNEKVLVSECVTKSVYCAKLRNEGNGLFWRSESGLAILENAILAWQPLPKPYKGGEDE